MKKRDIRKVIEILRHEAPRLKTPFVTFIAARTRDPFKVLISCILSLRTKDAATAGASNRLFALADNPERMMKLPAKKIEEAIYPVGFYRIKTATIIGICKDLIERYGGRTPDEIDELLKLRGVGRKTANLVVTIGYGKQGICVDTHVHRIANRWGYVETKNPEATEFALRDKLPKEYWIEINDLLVSFGQGICTPVSPKCSICPMERYCGKVGVERQR